MKGRFFTVILLLLFLLPSLPACTGKQEEAKPEKRAQEEAQTPAAPKIGPHTAGDVRKWVGDLEKTADPGLLMKLEPFTKKFSAGELIAGIATRSLPTYWNNVPEKDQLKTLAIMNTNFSKIRIEAGLVEAEEAKDKQVLNSTLYLEDEAGNIIAVSEAGRGNHILKKASKQPG